MPHTDAREAVSLILKTFDIPFWPQLPRLSFKEYMIPQYSEGMPFLRIDPEKETVSVERSGSDELDRFYETCGEETRIAISEDFATGLHTFLKVVKGSQFALLKGQVTGPLTFTLGLKDDKGRSVYFDEEFREISLMLLKAKTRWLIDMLKQSARQVIIFADEPILSALGSSSYLGVSSEETLRMLREIMTVIKAEGAIPGIHCCGNADWALVLKSGADIINFDAYDYIDTLALYPAELRGFLSRGGSLAWGIIPTSDAILEESIDPVKARMERGLEQLGRAIPLELVLSNILLTPSCGMGSRSIRETLKICQLLMRLKEDLL